MTTTSDLVFRVWTEASYGYTSTYVWISRYTRESVAETREGAVDNKAGYGSEDGARYWLDACERMTAASVEDYWNSSSGLAWSSMTIRWQHYSVEEGKQRYCSAAFELGDKLHEIDKSMEFLRELGRPIERARRRAYEKKHGFKSSRAFKVTDETFADPDELLAVLRRRKDAVEVERFSVGPHAWNTVFVRKGSVRSVEYTLEGVSSPGMEVSA